MDSRAKSRLQLLLLATLFVAPVLIALLLHQAGWRPQGMRNFGELVTPPQDMNGTPVQLQDGTAFVWRNDRWQWTLFAVASSHCESACLAQLDLLHRARLTLNQNVARVRLVYTGPLLSAAVLAQLQPIAVINDTNQPFATLRTNTPDSLSAALVDPNGFLMLRYTAGYNANGLKKDLTRLIH